MSTTQATESLTVRDLRRRWKPQKKRLAAEQPNHPASIRFHRACSWLARVAKIDDGADTDLALISQWVAFNALYGQWDSSAREPANDRRSWQTFMDRILKLDTEGYIEETLTEHKRLAIRLLEDEYLNRHFWRDPSADRARKSQRRGKYDAESFYRERRWAPLLDRLLEQID